MGHSDVEAAEDRGVFRHGGRWRLWGVQTWRPLEIVGRSDVATAGDGQKRLLLEEMSHWGWGLGFFSPTPFSFLSS